MSLADPTPDPAQFIRKRLPLAQVPMLAGLRLHLATPASGLRRLLEAHDSVEPPYWAYPWAGGLALAHHLLDNPALVRGRHVLDFGAGSGLVGIAAARAGASSVTCSEIDASGRVALALNAAANGVMLAILDADLTTGPAPAVDLVLAGDVFYEPGLAARALGFFDRCLAAGVEVVIGDIGRAHLPHERLRRLAEYSVPDFGGGHGNAVPGGVFALLP